ncbi:ABC transporter ATP-binding protein [Sulfolobus sp. A20]|uniref:ABC transporter ATP-binding protein n=1 Tax=Sulfolobaceae TaxID=118883 RepID=UPI000846248B|nr:MULTISPECIES: ABC transporter ATP-binding protein [unclassified Sulfolobus]TRM74639.1 ABC transporter ATP-binding protein [Sulfolobus sp. E5]TRM75169.1 ABC transporter ATP-binding protein [Sulfolobus sp. A20-N-F8]TRM82576.1 ABC transporter ATP-binding protein [Sulfolobus sp. A20-N-F6]TRM87294.1 ABC transporter ATP-binding protein [Sulfolobus sp. C3]TRM93620.1 ABC transporter ATP-binding protein [Sulfolobus sp. A20-N-G8]TRM99914.1 ABC transporter ATP-binding protein [Sulfolobus sp. E1]
MLLEVLNLSVVYSTNDKIIKAVNDVNFDLEKGEILGIIGESGSGKSTLAHAIIRAIKPPGKIVSGMILFNGTDLLSVSLEEFKKIMWKEISFVPQASQNALNPVINVYSSFKYIAESHGLKDESVMREKVNELIKSVGLDPKRVLSMYPFQLSGGMKQRIMIALSLLLDPKLIIMDEPTSALDMLNQELILRLIKEINRERQISIIFITHDILNVAQIADRLLVMYRGYVMEEGKAENIIKDPLNPYTKLLISSIPPVRGEIRPISIKEDASSLPISESCPFFSRCEYAFDRCKELPQLIGVKDRKVRCRLYESNGA